MASKLNPDVFVLHEFGAPTHYLALSFLLARHERRVLFRELNFLAQVRHALTNPRKIAKLVLNVCFVLSLRVRRKSTVVVAMAPCNRKLRWLRSRLSRHRVFYHTSHVDWSGLNWVYPPASRDDVETWRKWLSEDCAGIFAVTEASKNSLVRNGYSNPDRISVVAHSYNVPLSPLGSNGSRKSFLCVARLEPCKGILELFSWFREHPEATLSIVGSGGLENRILREIGTLSNVSFLGRSKSLEDLRSIYRRHAFLIQNSIRTGAWEEFFGMAIIEAMACGCIPIATNHAGPLEIISNGENGILVEEGGVPKALSEAIAMREADYRKLRDGAIRRGAQYASPEIASRWAMVLEERSRVQGPAGNREPRTGIRLATARKDPITGGAKQNAFS